MKNLFAFRKNLLIVTALMLLFVSSVFAQGTVDPNDPGSFIDPANTNPLLVGVIMLISYFSGVIPGLKNIKITWIRSAVVAVVAVAGFLTLKVGFLNSETVEYIVKAFFPNFAYSGFAYELLKTVFKLFGVDLKSLKAAN